jgi:thioredoxin-related protein
MNKHILKLIFLLIGIQSSSAQGIKFVASSFLQAQAQAQASQKPLFVEVYLTGCPHCAALAPHLNDKTVGDFYNANFVSYKVEANSPDSKTLQQTKNLKYTEFPLFFFFDTSGKLIHQAAPAEKKTAADYITEILKHGQDALNPKLRSSNYDKRYADGDKDFSFIVNYAKYCKATGNIARLSELNDMFGNTFKKPAELESETVMYLLKNLVNDGGNPMAMYFVNNLNKYKKYPAPDIKETVETLSYHLMYGPRANKATPEQIIAYRQGMIRVGVPEKDANNRTLLKLTEVYLKAAQTKNAITTVDAHIKKFGFMGAEGAYFAKYFNDTAKDASYVPALAQWVNAIAAKAKPTEKKELAEMYNELARAYKRVNNKAEADKATKKAASYK